MPYEKLPYKPDKKLQGNEHVPTGECYEILESMAMNGATHMQMADALGVCNKTLVKHYGEYLKTVKPLFDARVARQLKKNIFHEDPKIAMDATKFYLNSKVGYKQSSESTLNGDVGLSFKVAFEDTSES